MKKSIQRLMGVAFLHLCVWFMGLAHPDYILCRRVRYAD